MNTNFDINKFIEWHNALETFNYDLTIDWAIELIEKGIETENLLILASFSKPVDGYEIKPYVSAALNDLNLEEKYGEFSIVAEVHFYLNELIKSTSVREHLNQLYQLSLKYNREVGLDTFYRLYHAWLELDDFGVNYYYEGANLENIEQVIKEQAQIWIDTHVSE